MKLIVLAALFQVPYVARVAGVQAPSAAFPSSVELITVDAVVLDGDGRPVAGLTRDDFVVKEDGQPHEIVAFEAFAAEGDRQTATASPGHRSGDPRVGRAFAVIVDDLGLTAAETGEARRAVSSFLQESLRDGDDVVLATASGDAWWSARLPEGREDLLAVLARMNGRHVEPLLPLDKMSEYEAFAIQSTAGGGPVLERVVSRAQQSGGCITPSAAPSSAGDSFRRRCEALVRGEARAIDGARRQRTRATLQSVRRAAEALALRRGRKSLLLFSRGFVEDDDDGVRDVVAAAREANAAVYFLDGRGLVAPAGGGAAAAGPPPDPRELGAIAFEESVLASAGAQALAEDTGGSSIRHAGDLARAIRRMADESRVFYLLGFQAAAGKAPGKWRPLRVEVKREGLQVRARRGYTLRRASDPSHGGRRRKGMLDLAVERALDSPHDGSAIPLRAMAYVLDPRPKDATRVLLAVEFDARPLLLGAAGKSRAGAVEVSLVVSHRDSGRAYRRDERLRVTAEEDENGTWRALAREFELPAGVSQARIVVREPASGALGAVSHRFEVPPAGAFRFSTPIVTNRARPGERGRPQPALTAHRVFPPEGTLYCEFEVFGAARSGPVTASVSISTGDGRMVRRLEPTLIAPDGDGRLVRLLGVPLEGMQETGYEILLEARDEARGARLERRERFTLLWSP